MWKESLILFVCRPARQIESVESRCWIISETVVHGMGCQYGWIYWINRFTIRRDHATASATTFSQLLWDKILPHQKRPCCLPATTPHSLTCGSLSPIPPSFLKPFGNPLEVVMRGEGAYTLSLFPCCWLDASDAGLIRRSIHTALLQQLLEFTRLSDSTARKAFSYLRRAAVWSWTRLNTIEKACRFISTNQARPAHTHDSGTFFV